MTEGDPDHNNIPDLIPAHLLGEFAYCPRRCYIEWIEGEFVDCEAMTEGRFRHRQLEQDPKKLLDEDLQPVLAREISLTGPEIGITCRIDLLVGDKTSVIPVDYKRGSAPNVLEGAYEPERVQICAQGLVLRENGYNCNEGAVFYLKSKTRIPVLFDEALIQRTRDILAELRSVAAGGRMPRPLQDSPKCNRCSLGGICLPDEVNLLLEDSAEAPCESGAREEKKALEEIEERKVRMLLPARDDQLPVYVVGQGNTVRKRGDCLEVWSREGKVSEARLMEVSQVNLYGGVEITTPAMIDLMQRGVSISHFTHGGWFQGICQGTTHKNIELRICQFDRAKDSLKSLLLSRSFVSGKIKNCRTLVKRNNPDAPEKILDSMATLAREALEAMSMESLRGFEGAAAEIYFSQFPGLLKAKASEFTFHNRNRRPPRDPVNAVLSYLYGILAKDLFVTVQAVGFDPYLGFYHQPRYGRPALALDMMEEFRPLIADSTLFALFNKGELSKKDFIRSGIGVTISQEARKKVVAGYERRIQTEITHPIFGYTVSYRRVLLIQARLLARYLQGEIAEYPAFVTR